LKIVDSELLSKNSVKEVKEIELNIKDIDQIVELFHLSNDHVNFVNDIFRLFQF